MKNVMNLTKLAKGIFKMTKKHKKGSCHEKYDDSHKISKSIFNKTPRRYVMKIMMNLTKVPN